MLAPKTGLTSRPFRVDRKPKYFRSVCLFGVCLLWWSWFRWKPVLPSLLLAFNHSTIHISKAVQNKGNAMPWNCRSLWISRILSDGLTESDMSMCKSCSCSKSCYSIGWVSPCCDLSVSLSLSIFCLSRLWSLLGELTTVKLLLLCTPINANTKAIICHSLV